MRKNTFIFSLLIISIISLLSCSSDEGSGTARVNIYLTDDPADYDKVLIDIQEVRVHTSETAEENDGGWVTLAGTRTGIYDLLELSGGLDTLLGTAELPAGKISQIRLILGSNNTLVIDEEEIDLKTPSAQQSGLKLKVNTVLNAGITYDIILDFDVARSIVRAGNSGNYNLKPVIRAIAQAQDGAICGKVLPLESSPVVYAITGTDSLSAFPNEQGKFLFKGLEPGTYTLVLVPEDGYQTKTLNGVAVSLGQVNDLGTIQIENQ